jgi:hypothetical protein
MCSVECRFASVFGVWVTSECAFFISAMSSLGKKRCQATFHGDDFPFHLGETTTFSARFYLGRGSPYNHSQAR